MNKTFLCKYQVYAIKWIIFFTYECFSFGVPESYVMKVFMHLTDMQLTGIICIEGFLENGEHKT